MASEVTISNMALGHIGHSKIIQSLLENTNEANQCNAYLDIARDALLAVHPWLFAKRQVVMAEKSNPPSGWDYQYVLPIECINPLKIYNPDSEDDKDRIPFERRLSEDGNTQVIVTNKAQAELIYTHKIDNVSLMPEYFLLPFSYKLASLLVGPITKNDKATKQFVERDLAVSMSQAIMADTRAYHKDIERKEAAWTAARSG